MLSRLLLLVLLLVHTCAKPQTPHGFQAVDAWLTENAPAMGGRALLLVYQDGRVVYSHGVNEMGLKDKLLQRVYAKKLGQPVDLTAYTPTSRQAMASCSKWLSAALVMTFVDEGKLQLSDTVGRYLPVLSQHGKGRITIGQCLSHLTSIQAGPGGEDVQAMRASGSMDQTMEQIALLPVEGAPGKVFHYSGVGLQIAGAILEKISGQRFETLFADRVARPLQMQHTDFGQWQVALPAGGAFSTPQDYLNFLAMVLNNGTFHGQRVLSEASIAQMQLNRLTAEVRVLNSPIEAGAFGYGYGEWLLGADVVSSPGLFGSYPWINKRKKYAAFLLTLNLERAGRQKRYVELQQLVDNALH